MEDFAEDAVEEPEAGPEQNEPEERGFFALDGEAELGEEAADTEKNYDVESDVEQN